MGEARRQIGLCNYLSKPWPWSWEESNTQNVPKNTGLCNVARPVNFRTLRPIKTLSHGATEAACRVTGGASRAMDSRQAESLNAEVLQQVSLRF